MSTNIHTEIDEIDEIAELASEQKGSQSHHISRL